RYRRSAVPALSGCRVDRPSEKPVPRSKNTCAVPRAELARSTSNRKGTSRDGAMPGRKGNERTMARMAADNRARRPDLMLTAELAQRERDHVAVSSGTTGLEAPDPASISWPRLTLYSILSSHSRPIPWGAENRPSAVASPSVHLADPL